MRDHDVADALDLLARRQMQGDTQATALLSYVENLETRILDACIIIDELKAELHDRTQQVQAYKELIR